MTDSGYVPCGCFICMNVTVGFPGDYCWDCEVAGCDDYQDCQVMEEE